MVDSTTVECCVNNVDFETYRHLQDADAGIDQQHCLGRCGVCHDDTFLLIDGELHRGSHADLLAGLGE